MARVLVVDDEKWICSVLQDYLEEAGYSVDVANTLSDARDQVRTAVALPDLMVLDLTLPDGNGLSLLREMKENGVTKGVPIIVVTAHPLRESDRQRIFDQKADDCIAKPFKLSEFRQRIEVHLNANRPGPDAPALPGH